MTITDNGDFNDKVFVHDLNDKVFDDDLNQSKRIMTVVGWGGMTVR